MKRTVKISRRSVVTGNQHTRELPITPEEYEECMHRYNRGMMVQDAFPMLSVDDREFLKTGITPEEWAQYIATPDDEEVEEERDRGFFIHTYSGKQCWPLDSRPDEIDLISIAHALACSTRFNGHTRSPYSIAQHSVLVSRYCDPSVALEGLMHDATEAYIGDIVLPVKCQFPQIEEAEKRLWEIIAGVFDLDPGPFHPSIVHADKVVLATEARDLFNEEAPWVRDLGVEPVEERIMPWDWVYAQEQFIIQYLKLKDERHG